MKPKYLPARSFLRKSGKPQVHRYLQLTAFVMRFSCVSAEYAGHLEQVAGVGGVAAAGANLEVEVDLVVLVRLFEVEVLDGQAVWRLEVAELEVVGGDEGDAPVAREALDGFGGSCDAVGGVRAFEDLVDA